MKWQYNNETNINDEMNEMTLIILTMTNDNNEEIIIIMIIIIMMNNDEYEIWKWQY